MTASRQIVIVPIAALDQAQLATWRAAVRSPSGFSASSFARFAELRDASAARMVDAGPGPVAQWRSRNGCGISSSISTRISSRED